MCFAFCMYATYIEVSSYLYLCTYICTNTKSSPVLRFLSIKENNILFLFVIIVCCFRQILISFLLLHNYST